MARINEKESRVQVERRNKKKHILCIFLMNFLEVLKVLEILITYLMKACFFLEQHLTKDFLDLESKVPIFKS